MSTSKYRKIEVRKTKKEAINNSCTRTAKAKAQHKYSEANKEVKKSVRKDKREYVEELAEQAETEAASRNMKELFDTTKEIAGRSKPMERPVKDKDGKVLMERKKQLNRWAEHLEELLNRPKPDNTPDILPADTDLPINCKPPSRGEIQRAIKQLKNGKAPGPDEIPAEALKTDPSIMVEILYNMFAKIWEEEEIPSEWKEGHPIKLPKKGDLGQC
jgi:hypothetical protein